MLSCTTYKIYPQFKFCQKFLSNQFSNCAWGKQILSPEKNISVLRGLVCLLLGHNIRYFNILLPQ